MLDPLEHVRELAQQARVEEAPRVHIVPQLLQRLHEEEASSTMNPALFVFALTSMATSLAVVAAGLLTLPEQEDPLVSFIETATTLLPWQLI